MNNKIRVKVSVNTKYVGSEAHDYLEFDRSDFEGMSHEEMWREIDKQAFDFLTESLINWTCYEVDEDGEEI